MNPTGATITTKGGTQHGGKNKRKRKNSIVVIGEAKDGKQVLSNVFRFYDTVGLPLTVVFQILDDKGFLICWSSFFQDATKAGWKPETILSRLEESIVDVYGKGFWLKVREKLMIIEGGA